MGFGEFELLELRYIDRGTTMSTAYIAADNAAWNAGTAVKLRAFDVNIDGLVYNTIADMSIQQHFYGKPAPIKTTKEGTFSFKMWLEGGTGDNTAGTVATILGGIMGGKKVAPQADATDEAEAASTTTNIKATSHGLEEGQVCLIGSVGDAGGDGRCCVVKTANASDFDLEFALPAAPGVGDKIYEGTTCYFDPDVQNYFDFLIIGSYSGSGVADDPDQFQCIGASGTFALGGLGMDEKPYVEFTFSTGQWRHVNYADQATFSYATSANGGDPVGDMQAGSMVLQDASGTTRNAIAAGEIEINPNMSLSRIQNLNYTNRIGGWKKVPSEEGPSVAITQYWGDCPSILQDFEGVAGNETPTAKQMLLQFGQTNTGTVAIYFQRLFLKSLPARVELEKNTALKLEFSADTGRATAYSTANDKLQDSPMTITFI